MLPMRAHGDGISRERQECDVETRWLHQKLKLFNLLRAGSTFEFGGEGCYPSRSASSAIPLLSPTNRQRVACRGEGRRAHPAYLVPT